MDPHSKEPEGTETLDSIYEDLDSESLKTDEGASPESNETVPEAIQAPEHWDEEHRDQFNAWPEEVRDQYMDRHKSMEGDYTRKSQEHASDLKLAADLQKSLEPFRQDFVGSTETQTMDRFLQMHQQLKTNPAEALMELARVYNYQPQVAPQENFEEDYFENPGMNDMRTQMQTMQNELLNYKQEQHRSAQVAYGNDFDAFANAKTDNIDSHPYAVELKADIDNMLHGGFAKDFNMAYNMALASKPELQKQIQERNAEIKRKVERQEHIKSVSKAKNASSASVKSSVSNVQSGKQGDLRSELSSLFDELQNQS